MWYACQTGSRFVGCCRNNPCSRGCPPRSLAPASLDPTQQSRLKDQSCPTGSRWYTCAATDPPFVGCCELNPCALGSCPQAALAAGYLSPNPNIAASILGNGTSDSSSDSGPNVAAIVGGVVGGGVFLLLLSGLLFAWWWWRRRQRIRRAAAHSDVAATDLTSADFGNKPSPGSGMNYSGKLTAGRLSSPAHDVC